MGLLIVETGAGVPNANSYDHSANCIAYALARGIVLPADPTEVGQVASWLVIGTDYLESFAARYVGQPTALTQSLSWPRMNVQFAPDTPYPSNVIPPQLIAALDECVIAQFNGLVLQPNVDHSQGGYVTESKVDVLITKFSEKIGTTSAPLLPKVASMLSQLLNPNVALRTVRV